MCDAYSDDAHYDTMQKTQFCPPIYPKKSVSSLHLVHGWDWAMEKPINSAAVVKMNDVRGFGEPRDWPFFLSSSFSQGGKLGIDKQLIVCPVPLRFFFS